MADIRVQAKSAVTALTILDTDVFFVDSASGGTVRKFALSELIIKVLGGNITPGTAIPSAALIVDADKKIEEVGGILMNSAYVPTANQDVVTKTYLDDTVLDQNFPVLMLKKVLTYAEFTSGVAVTLKTMSAGNMVLGIFVYIKTAFTDTGTDLMKLGITSDDDHFATDFDVSSTGWKTIDAITFPYRCSAEDLTVTYTGQNDDADDGSVEIYIQYIKATT